MCSSPLGAVADIVEGGDSVEFGSYFLGDTFEAGDKVFNRFLVDVGIGTCKGFEGLVGFGITFAAKDCLDSLGYNRPVVVEIGLDCFGADNELAKTLEGRFKGNQCVRERNAQVADYGRIGKVALQTRDR